MNRLNKQFIDRGYQSDFISWLRILSLRNPSSTTLDLKQPIKIRGCVPFDKKLFISNNVSFPTLTSWFYWDERNKPELSKDWKEYKRNLFLIS